MNLFSKIYIVCVLVLSVGLTPAVGQKVYSVRDIPNTRLGNASAHVSNPDGTLSSSTVAEVNTILGKLQSGNGIEVAVVVISSIGNAAIEDFAVDLFRSWGIGRKGQDNGLLMLLVTDDRLVRFEVGYGLEGDLPDAIAKRIQSQRMLPYLRVGDWDNAVMAGVLGIYEYLNDPDSELKNGLTGIPAAEDDLIRGMLFIFGGMVVLIAVAMFAHRRRNKCPRCGHQMKQTNTTTAKLSENVRLITTTLVCPNCGYTTHRNTRQNLHSGGGGYIGPIGGGFGGRGGGFGGGSWGGGRSGGGGATTRF